MNTLRKCSSTAVIDNEDMHTNLVRGHWCTGEDKTTLLLFLYSIVVKSNYSLHKSEVYYAKARIAVVYSVFDAVLQPNLYYHTSN